MNNNNLYNTNSWIGTTHQDFFHNSSNNLYFYTSNTSNILSNQIIITSNIIENDILITSNILEISSSNKTSNLRYDINKLINEEIEHISLPIPYNLKHTYIYNSNLLGEIRFWCKSTTDFPVFIPLGVPDYRVKIDVDGKLKVYYTYDPSINATFGNGWVDVANSIVALNASDANIGVSLAGLGASIVSNYAYFEQKIENLLFGLKSLGILNDNDIKGLLERFSKFKYETFPTNASVASIFQDIKEFFRTGLSNFLERAVNNITIRITQNPIASFFLGLGGLAFAGATGAIQNMQYLEIISTILNSNITSNSNISPQRRIDVLSSNTDEYISTTMDYCSNMYNMSLYQGFLNSNVLSQQFLNNLKVSSLNLNAGNITNLNTINGTTGIFGSISTTNNTNEAIPSITNFGGLGDKIIIKTGTSTTYPSSIGIENNALWISGQDNINFYNRGNKTLSLTSNKSTEIFGELLCNSNIKLNQINISNIFVASNVLDTTSNILSNSIFNSSNNNSIYTSNSSNILSNLIFNSSNNNSIYTSNSSNINFNYTSNSLFSNLIPIYASSNAVKDIIIFDTPQVNKKSAFYCMTNNIIYINGGSVPYYAYHIDLRNYTKTGYIDIGSGSGDVYRIFTIKAFFGSSYFQKLTNGIPDICEYTIYMSNKANSGGSGTISGLNIQAIGVPNNPFLNNSVNNNLFILRNSNGNFNYISIVTTSPADVRVFVEDLLN